jgi:hypothetical protein
MTAPSPLQNAFETVFFGWLENGHRPPAEALEGITPVFGYLAGKLSAEFTFEAYFHTEPQAGWAWAATEFNEIFDGRFYFYWPSTWAVTEQKTAMAVTAEEGEPRQNIFLAQRHHWQPRIHEHLAQQQLLAFAYMPMLWPNYSHWLMVLSTKQPNTVAITSAFSSGEWLVVIESLAASADELNQQLTARLNSNPWYGWIQAAKAHRENPSPKRG